MFSSNFNIDRVLHMFTMLHTTAAASFSRIHESLGAHWLSYIKPLSGFPVSFFKLCFHSLLQAPGLCAVCPP